MKLNVHLVRWLVPVILLIIAAMIAIFEGFGIALTEAHAAGLSVVARKLPVFEERFGKESINTVKLVEMGNTLQFAREAVASVSEWRKISIKPGIWRIKNRKDLGTGGNRCNLRIK
jgi:hypothetical protein